jgi:group I intron endonuclease
MLINKAILKYGYSNFKLEILEYTDKDKNLEREQYYLDLIKPEYNILQTAGSMFGFRHTEDTILKMREAKLGISYPPITPPSP